MKTLQGDDLCGNEFGMELSRLGGRGCGSTSSPTSKDRTTVGRLLRTVATIRRGHTWSTKDEKTRAREEVGRLDNEETSAR